MSDDIYQTQSGEQGTLDQDANSQALKISYQNQHVDVLSVTARRESDSAYTTDFDFLPQPFIFQQTQLLQEQWSQEFRIKSLDESIWRWSLGFFYSTNDLSARQVNTIFQASDNLDLKKLDETAYAAFGQISYQGFDAVRIFLDLRLDFVEKEIESSLRSMSGQTTQLNDAKNDVFFSPKLILEYLLTQQIRTYFSTGLAFKPGGFSAQSNAFPEYDKETLWNNEIGVKSTWLNKRLTADLSLFYYDIENYQLEEIFTPADYTVINAPKVISYGAEFNFGAKIIEAFHINGSFAYTQIEFKDFIDPFTGDNFQDNHAPYVPRFNFNIAGIFKHPTGFFARLGFLWTGKTYFDAVNSGAFSEQDYTVVNALISYEYKFFSINAYVKNLTESNYYTYKITRLNLGAPGEPRTFGARVSLNF